jgi:hypothetical protein
MTVRTGGRTPAIDGAYPCVSFCGAGCSGPSFFLVLVAGAVVAMLTFVGNLWPRDDELSRETLLGIQFC